MIIANNVIAHVPNLNDFVKGLKILLENDGIISIEFPHILKLIQKNQFDTIYHEHFSYLSLYAVDSIFQEAGLRIWNVEQLSTHGGSLRVFGCHDDDLRVTKQVVTTLMQKESECGLQQLQTYLKFQPRADQIKNDLLAFLIEQKHNGKEVCAYGAAAKGNTLLNYAGVKPDLLPIIYDAAPAKQNKYMPGSHIPIFNPDKIKEEMPDYILILPWNIADEVMEQNGFIRELGGKFVTAVPEITIR